MNMLGIMTPMIPEAEIPRRTPADRAWTWVREKRVFLLVVALPTLLVAAYLYLVSADQYESEAHFLVRTTSATAMPGIGVSQALSMATGLSSAQSEAMSVSDYLTSHDVVATLRRDADLVGRYRRPEADVLARLSSNNPTPERLLKYYRRQVTVEYNTETGITSLKVHAFRPDDAYLLLRRLLELGEQRVNALNVRSYNDAIAMSRRQLAEAENAMAVNQSRMTNFRQTRRDIDPQASGQAQIGLVTTMTGQLAAAQAQLTAMRGMISPASPQYRALEGRVAALRQQVGAQTGRLTGGSTAIAADIGNYETLRLRQEFLAKRYDAAATALEKARDSALRQQLYVVRVVDANMPVKALFPQRFRILMTVFVALLLVYAISWLIVAGVREHSA